MDLRTAFGKRFHELVLESGRTHRDLAAELQANLHDVIRWDTGKNDYLPSVRLLCRMAGLFRCSVDYLLGRSDDEAVGELPPTEPQLAGRFRAFVYARGFTFARLAREADIHSTTLFYNWEKGKSLPQAELLCRVADALECSADELLAPARPGTF